MISLGNSLISSRVYDLLNIEDRARPSPHKSMMHVTYSPISTKFINPPYIRNIYKFPTFLA